MTTSTNERGHRMTAGDAADKSKPRTAQAALTALVLSSLLGACTGNLLEAQPVCIQPHGGANVQLAPNDQFDAGAAGYAWVNGADLKVAGKDR